MPIEYTETGRIKRVQADSILETKVVINEMRSKRQEYETLGKSLAMSSAQVRATFLQTATRRPPQFHGGLTHHRLENEIRPLQMQRLQLERTIAEIDSCIWKLDSYLARILGTGLNQQDFCLHYQPIVALDTGHISGFEALVRWQRAKSGFTFPSEFIPLAEETGLIVHLDRWVLLEACRQMREWQRQYPGRENLTMSVNLSSKHLTQPDFVEHMATILEQSDLPAQNLKLEVTESALIDHIEPVAANLEALRDLGLQMSVDDFGGDMSAHYLKRLSLNTLNMDRSLINGLDDEETGRQAVQTIISGAHDQQMAVVAKGVETSAQFGHLRTLQGEYAQGYFFSKAVDSETASDMISQKVQW